MHIWVDADACPGVIKDILYRAAERLEIPLTLVANKPLRIPASRFIRTLQVLRGFDVADDEIAARVQPGDLVVTADIPLAARVLERGAVCLDFRGGEFSPRTIGDAVAMRELHRYLRDLGELPGGPAAFSPRDRSRFASKLDAVLARLTREASQ